jgi:hypothetical protein
MLCHCGLKEISFAKMLLDQVSFLKESPYEINAFEWLDTIINKVTTIAHSPPTIIGLCVHSTNRLKKV